MQCSAEKACRAAPPKQQKIRENAGKYSTVIGGDHSWETSTKTEKSGLHIPPSFVESLHNDRSSGTGKDAGTKKKRKRYIVRVYIKHEGRLNSNVERPRRRIEMKQSGKV